MCEVGFKVLEVAFISRAGSGGYHVTFLCEGVSFFAFDGVIAEVAYPFKLTYVGVYGFLVVLSYVRYYGIV